MKVKPTKVDRGRKHAARGRRPPSTTRAPSVDEDQPYFDISQIRPNAVFEVLADAIRLLADALRAGRITPDQLAERLLKVERAVREQ
jgi:hypothetical protein